MSQELIMPDEIPTLILPAPTAMPVRVLVPPQENMRVRLTLFKEVMEALSAPLVNLDAATDEELYAIDQAIQDALLTQFRRPEFRDVIRNHITNLGYELNLTDEQRFELGSKLNRLAMR